MRPSQEGPYTGEFIQALNPAVSWPPTTSRWASPPPVLITVHSFTQPLTQQVFADSCSVPDHGLGLGNERS